MGARVVVRRRLDPDETTPGGHVWTDVIGVVLAASDDGLRLRPDAPRRRASDASGVAGRTAEVVVPAASIAAAKRIGPRPAPRGGR